MTGTTPNDELAELHATWKEVSTYDEMPDGQCAIFALCAKELKETIEDTPNTSQRHGSYRDYDAYPPMEDLEE